jgi:formylglycine-generating enzyme required for sulfatase activity
MIAIPSGEFAMGSRKGDDDERPVHLVTVAAFAIDKTEVTVGAYRACVGTRACTPTGTGAYCNAIRAGTDLHPVNCVDWEQASAFCRFRQLRLPTEAEWEYAARGTDGRTYPWGETKPATQLCWDGPGSELGLGRRRGTCAVGTHASGRSAFGVDDMAGNVWEWTSDYYTPAYGEPPTEWRVVRGGTWFGYDRADVRASLRFRQSHTARDYGVGFRCAKSL